LTRAPLRFVFDVPPLYDDVDERLRVLERFLAIARERHIALVIDETYKDFLPGDAPPHPLFQDADDRPIPRDSAELRLFPRYTFAAANGDASAGFDPGDWFRRVGDHAGIDIEISDLAIGFQAASGPVEVPSLGSGSVSDPSR